MPEPFTEFRALYPPRPRGAINPATLSRYKGFFGQYKYNDIRTLIYLFPDGRVELLTRHKVPHRFYELTEKMTENLRSLDLERGHFHILDGGVQRVPMKLPRGEERPVILWDILVHKSVYLTGSTYRQRSALLTRICGHPKQLEKKTSHELGLVIEDSLWLAPTFKRGFEERYRATSTMEEVEGLILKDPNGKLERAVREENNGSWMIRVRKQTASYVF